MARSVTSPDGRQWTVRRRWTNRRLPHWRRIRSGTSGGGDAAWWALDVGNDFLAGIAIALVVLVLVGVFVFLVIPLIVFTLELLVVLLVVALAALGRVLLGRPWTVEARSGDDVRTYAVKGWRASAEKVDEVATSLERGALATPSATAATTAR
jgi:hypothetical protein